MQLTDRTALDKLSQNSPLWIYDLPVVDNNDHQAISKRQALCKTEQSGKSGKYPLLLLYGNCSFPVLQSG
jgi:hypothetical protein